jgi:hypothetical protein
VHLLVRPPLVLHYITPDIPSGIQAGGIFVNKNAEKFFNAEFRRAGCDISDIQIAVEEFEKEKKRFCNEREGLKLRVGNSRMNVPSINLKRGYLELKGSANDLHRVVTVCLSFFHSDQVARFFTGVVQDIATSVIGQMQDYYAQVSVFFQAMALYLNSIGKSVILVGGFGDSQYLRRDSEMPRSKC